MKFKPAVLTVFLAASLAACGSDNDDGSDSSTSTSGNASGELIGTWLSNCHEFFGTENELGNNLYNVSELTFTETEYVDRYISYSDVNCTENPIEESNSTKYTIGEMVSTTDGVAATRMTLTPLLPDGSDAEFVLQAIYRISGVELNLGEFVEGDVPSINQNPTYIKQ